MNLIFTIRIKAAVAAFILLASINCLAQKQTTVTARVADANRSHDTLILRRGLMTDTYHGNAEKRFAVVNGKAVIKDGFSYPKLFYIGWGSEQDNIISHAGEYFIDATTTTVTIDSVYAKSAVSGRTADEFKNQFSPFILFGKAEATVGWYAYEHGDAFDVQLAQYTAAHPDSYVALWFLIHRFNESGYKEAYGGILQSFSKKMKKAQLWMILDGEFKKIRIREGQKFPALALQDINLKSEAVSIPLAQYTLVDLWFSRCRPCLEQVPHWRALYDKYNGKGFNIINISTDRTANIPLWQKRVVERGIIWKNYLDENAVEASAEKIYSFPTNFLLDKNGVVIKKNISPEELEKLLSETL